MRFDFLGLRHHRVRATAQGLDIAGQRFGLDQTLEMGDGLGTVPVRAIAQAAERQAQLTHGQCQPQVAAQVYAATRQPRALYFYFPLTRLLTPDELTRFDQGLLQLVQHPAFEVRLIGEDRVDLTAQLPVEVAGLVAGHLLEIYFYRPDILKRFLDQPRHFRLYATQRAFEQDGGQAGGNYHADREAVQLVLARLFEGFNEPTPGVAPFLHELGHMLDFFEAATGTMGQSEGLLPGLSPRDGALYTPQARALFLTGKRLELERYRACAAQPADPLPIGHPYVFQNDTEFAAGYFEMFFRNPHYFAAQNPDLFQAYVALFGYDPRPAWKQDFPFYVDENRRFYLSGQKPWPTHLTVPDA